ncbi:cupredoxin domain-containing protein [Natronorubrum texcoconense]|nr:plastocyanin/azurin family copper-binding protein [Natronorubrum texcoconense]
MASEGDTFEWDAEETGTQPYYCSPHAGFMYGALEIE